MSNDDDDAMAAVFAQKSALRKSMLKTLRGLSEAELASQSAAVARILREQPFYNNARSVCCYLSMAKGELRTNEIVTDILANKDRTLYTPYLPPRTDESPVMHMLRLYNTADLGACPLDKWGILDPGETRRDPGREGEKRQDVLDIDADPLDVILVPGVAFDKDCNRLGRGKAFYDTFLAKYTHRTRPLLIALALEPQITDEPVPVTPSDFTLDGVISPAGLVWREGAKRE